MSRWSVFVVVLGAAGFVANAVAQTPAEPPLRADWCETDDPAVFVAMARKAETGELDSLCTQVDVQSGETLPDALALPLPCGHRLLFRKVRVPADFLLDQRVAAFGSSSGGANASAKFTRGPWDAPISGVFSEDEDGRPVVGNLDTVSARGFYVGKYELTELQYALFSDGLFESGRGLSIDAPECATARQRADAASPSRIVPATRLSWFGAIDFSRQYNAWLFALDRARMKAGLAPVLPWNRAPAATCGWPPRRNGNTPLAAARRERGQRTGPGRCPGCAIRKAAACAMPRSTRWRWCSFRRVPECLRFAEWVPGRRTCWGCTMVVGNAEELILDLFRATRPDSLHGHAGGALTRGGSALTGDGVIGVGYRRELPLYDHPTGEGTSDLVGARLVVSAPFFVAGAVAGAARYTPDVQNVSLREDLERSQEILQDKRDTGRRETERNMDNLVRLLEEQKFDRERIAAQVGELQAMLGSARRHARRCLPAHVARTRAHGGGDRCRDPQHRTIDLVAAFEPPQCAGQDEGSGLAAQRPPAPGSGAREAGRTVAATG